LRAGGVSNIALKPLLLNASALVLAVAFQHAALPMVAHGVAGAIAGASFVVLAGVGNGLLFKEAWLELWHGLVHALRRRAANRGPKQSSSVAMRSEA
jgi:hypothetical protein